MTRRLISLKQIIPVLIVIAAGVLPLYAQADSQSDIFKAAAQSTQDGPCWGAVQDDGIRGYAIVHRRSPVHPQSGGRFDLDKIPHLELGEARAVPVKRLTRANEINGDQSFFSRFALSAGGTPAVPVKRLTPALRTDASQSTDEDHSTEANQSPDANQSADGNQGNQSASDPYVFPTRKERFNRYLKSMFGPSALVRSAVTAGINQWTDSPEEWEQGMSGYGKRVASSFGRNVIHHTVIYGLDSALSWDTGFRKSPDKAFGARVKHALLENITSRTKSGKRVISVPRIAGAYTSGVISREAWYPERYGYKDGLRSGTNVLLTGFALALVREFVFNF
ncbi:MAG TPA: hypothetical protein VJV03_01940 [Pyrinomonadaceae bacterium]|nr:hypothetical protein [Pyrinomonadaceae bacterium]